MSKNKSADYAQIAREKAHEALVAENDHTAKKLYEIARKFDPDYDDDGKNYIKK